MISYDSLTPIVELFTQDGTSITHLTNSIFKQCATADVPLITHEDVRQKLDELATRNLKHFSAGWISYPEEGTPKYLEWTGSVMKKERRSWRCQFAENDASALAPFRQIHYIHITPILDETISDLCHLNGETPFKTDVLDGDTITLHELIKLWETCPETTQIPPEMERSLAKSTRSKHRQMINTILAAPVTYYGLPTKQS